jgi:amidase
MDLDAVAQAELVRTGQISAVELVEASIERIESRNPAVNAVIHRSYETALAAARRGDGSDAAFRGVPMVFKDTALVAGEPVHVGTRALRDGDARAPIDDIYVTKLQAAGFVSVGKTTTSELAMQATVETIAHGTTANPWALGHTTGGSSGGSAAAVAAGMVAVGHGNDGGGSIRIPAAACGLVGLKSSRGRISAGPLPEGPGTNRVEGVLCRSVRDVAAVLDVMACSMPGDPHPLPSPASSFTERCQQSPEALRCSVMTSWPGAPKTHPECVVAVEMAADVLRELGHVAESGAPPLPDWERLRSDFLISFSVAIPGLVRGLSALIGRRIAPDELEPAQEALYRHGESLTAQDLLRAYGHRDATARACGMWFADGNDLLVMPVTRTPAPRLGELVPADRDPLAAWLNHCDWFPFTPLWNALGNPAISVPVHEHEGLPVAVQLIAPYGREDLLLQVAMQLEQAFSWQQRRPRTSS